VKDLRVPPVGGAPRPWFVFAGGGTGGHLFPALSVVEWLRSGDAVDVSFFCTGRPIDREILGAAGVEAIPLSVQPLPRRPWQAPAFLWHWLQSVRQCVAAFRRRRPAVVVGAGGYASGPPVHAGLKLGIPTFLLNPDALPGQANKHLARRKTMSGIFAQWPITLEHLPARAPVTVSGCPVRSTFLEYRPDLQPLAPATAAFMTGREAESPREECAGETQDRQQFLRPGTVVRLPVQAAARANFGLRPDLHTLLVTGASQGARTVNEVMMRLGHTVAAAGWQVLHLSGAPDWERVEQSYERARVTAIVLPFVEQMAEAMVAADLIVSRAGASSLAEILAVGRPSVLLPYPFHRDRHQWHNGQVLVDAGAAVMLEDRRDAAATAAELEPLLNELMSDHARRQRMADAARVLGRPDAGYLVSDVLAQVAAAPQGTSCRLSGGCGLQLTMIWPGVEF
jgi:UDP-N-acetylglucosamine--N-acetylmuramyl-(pentapeptide) pyrophosphoryl-undecaprenol N-acetylglucosamine transferase